MKEFEFIKELESRLTNFSEEEKNKILFYYDDLIYGAVDSGIREEDAISDLGSIDDIVKKIMENYPKDTTEDIKQEPFKKLVVSRGFGRKINVIKESNIETLNINTGSSNVLFQRALSNEIEIEHFNSPFSELFLSTKGDTLYIDNSTNRFRGYIIRAIIIIFISALSLLLLPNKWWLKLTVFFSVYVGIQAIFEFTCLFLKVNKIIIKIPEYRYNLNMNGKSGSYKSIGIPYKNVNATANSGCLKFYNTKADSFYLKTSSGVIKLVNEELDIPLVTNDIVTLAKSGTIKVCNYNCKNVISRCKSGTIKLIKLASENNIDITNSSGCIKGIELSANSLNAKAKSGTIKFRGLKCSNLLNLSANSGSIKGYDVESPKVRSTVKSGIIKYKGLISTDEIQLSAISGVVKTVDSSFIKAVGSASSGSVKFLRTKGCRKEYNLNLHSNVGSVKVKELMVDNSEFVDEKSFTSNKSITANTKSGSVKVTFMNI